jgi:sugar phosphate isomerase/epimerase
MPSISTHYAGTVIGSPLPQIQAIAEAGFSHLHWSHQWNTDFFYSRSEIDQIASWLREYGLKMTDLHGSQGVEKDWCSTEEYKRLAGVELVTNRIEMISELRGNAVVIHMTSEPSETKANAVYWASVNRTLDALALPCRQCGVRLAIENVGPAQPDGFYCFDTIEKVFARYGADYVGLCYDSGHGNEAGDGLDRLERVNDRLAAIHLHDNDGTSDQHKMPFTGTADWPRLTSIIARSPYRGAATLETGMRSNNFDDPKAFLTSALKVSRTLEVMIRDSRQAGIKA